MYKYYKNDLLLFNFWVHNILIFRENNLLIINSKPHPQSSAPATNSFNAVLSKPSGTTASIIFLSASQMKHVKSTNPVEMAIHGTRAVILSEKVIDMFL